jgi:predicted transglutaminase-like protease
MRTKKPNPKIEKNAEDVSDLEVAKKMLKIYQSAQDRKLKFDLSFESVKKLLSHQTCFYTNRKFEDDGAFSRSFDRVDSAKGYVEGNVVACTIDINGKKSNLSMEEIECIYNKLVKVLPKKKPVQDIEVEIIEISEEEPKSEETQADI